MKRVLSLIMAILFLLQGFSAFGDVVFAPESEFYDQHRKECTRVERNYYTNGEKGYIALYKKPNGPVVKYLTNAQKLHIFCTYQGWGMISYLNGVEQEIDRWVKMSELYLIYDEKSFQEEHQDEFYKTALELKANEMETKKIYVYEYPGAKDPWDYTLRDDETIMLGSHYIDPEGRSWGRVDYHYGIRGEWICFSNPDKVIEPFGGDPNIEKFQKYSANIPFLESDEPTNDNEIEEPVPDVPDTEKDDTVVSAPESGNIDNDEVYETEDTILESTTNQVFLPEDPPHRVPMDPLVIMAIVLVTAAVITAVVLIIVCYKRKEQ